MPDCPNCGFPFEPASEEDCRKCGDPLPLTLRGLLHIDIAHHGETWEEARLKLNRGIDRALQDYHSGLKVVHGYGSGGRGAVIAPQAIALMKHAAREVGGRYTKDKYNPGASILWLND